MASLTQAQTIEAFHLAFLQVLFSRVQPSSVALKGGANLRYFFSSHRYSEDIDFDVVSGEPWKLLDQVDQAIASPALQIVLRSSSIRMVQSSSSKQTGTTQRWKLLLTSSGLSQPVSTKVEFSRRNGDHRFQLEAVPEHVVAPYALRPPTVLHYTAAAATEQKVAALALRSETQARDIFDLDLLFRSHPGAVGPDALDPDTVRAAIERCLELPVEAFAGQVIAFLDANVAALYVDPATWEQMQLFVAARLEELLDERS